LRERMRAAAFTAGMNSRSESDMPQFAVFAVFTVF
jgi:hypothetical protein